MMNLADPELELVDPTPNVHTLFLHFDKEFFWTKLASRAVVRWSKRMYSCAGICSYEGRGGLCDIALSEPLLKLRPRKDLIETLLHEMIHAFLFVTNRDQDRDGHGPNFKAHMHRINKSAGLNISIYHSFHDEVKLYQTHWWRCNGPCQTKRPHFGIVRRSMNRPPGPSDYWWNYHKKQCGGTFVKIKEPENFKSKPKNSEGTKKNNTSKVYGDITKYINNNNNIRTINNISNTDKSILKDSNSNIKSSSPSTFIVPKKGVVFNPTVSKPGSHGIFTGSGHTLAEVKHISDHRSVTEHVRNIWANKEIPSVLNKPKSSTIEKKPGKPAGSFTSSKHKANDSLISPPAKIKKIDDYFKSNATTVLKDLYGEDFKLTQNHDSTKLVAVKQDIVDCPICHSKIDKIKINQHIDECLNKDIIKELSPPVSNFKGSIGNIVDLTSYFEEESVQIIVNTAKTKSDASPVLQSMKTNDTRSDGNLKDKDNDLFNFKTEPPSKSDTKFEPVPSTSKDLEKLAQTCPCCGKEFDMTVDEHLEECLVFSQCDNISQDNSSTSNISAIIVEDGIDIFDESQEFNETGTKTPCPCCMQMVEEIAMNDHLDLCLGLT